ncbi:hypothetical protein Hypma_012987 [Hypsizygus marmoreus]|uniref:F-box domain-containing protein n=1 Tax=Hypsizygus marmoreus TaxID=39966 RepID=A0A369JMP1_HYPMA|nr:hypothetical protein Hypma_012987 [Hypsizygus marmoreus]
MLRRSTRLRARVDSSDKVIGQGAADSLPKPNKTNSQESPKRQRRTAAPKVQCNGPERKVANLRGALTRLTVIPLDILFEIFGHLSPADILHLSWTNKMLKELLESESAAFIWRRARANVGLPDGPSDMSEPLLAKMVFDSHCDYCQCANAKTILWPIGARTCQKCLSNPRKFHFNISNDQLVIPSDIILIATIPRFGHGQPIHIGYCRRTARQLNDYYMTLDDKAKEQWIETKRDQKRTRLQYKELYEKWASEQAEQDLAEKQRIRLKRREAIMEKLRELGWGSELEKMAVGDNTLNSHPFVKQAKDLTERSWHANQSEIIQIMDAIMEKRLAREYRALQKVRREILLDVYHDFLASQATDAIIPGPADVALMPEFQAVVNSPLNVIVTADDFHAAVLELPSLIREWRSATAAKLVAFVNKADKSLHATESSLALSTVFFRCSYCGGVLAHPHVLTHACLTLMPCIPHHPDRDIFEDLGFQAWNESSIIYFDRDAYQFGTQLLHGWGLDADACPTKQTLEDPAFFIECILCAHEHERVLMTWQVAVNHSPACAPHMRCVGLSDNDKAIVQAIIAKKDGEYRASLYHCHWICLICRRKFNWNDLNNHVTDRHRGGIISPLVESLDYVPDVDHQALLRSELFRITDMVEILDV